MPTNKITLAQVREQHTPEYRRRRSGMGAISGRQLYNWHVHCSCGWSDTTNCNKKEQERSWKWHTREEWEKLRKGEAPSSHTTAGA